nr:hypothetical protein BaRGS_010317 [Batillaria attramentaria]
MRVHVYLDDWLVLAGSQDMCSLHTRSVLEQAAALGFRINLQKSDLVPAQQFKFLASGEWPPDQKTLHINLLELEAVRLSLKAFQTTLTGWLLGCRLSGCFTEGSFKFKPAVDYRSAMLVGTAPDFTLTVNWTEVRPWDAGKWRLVLANNIGSGTFDFLLSVTLPEGPPKFTDDNPTKYTATVSEGISLTFSVRTHTKDIASCRTDPMTETQLDDTSRNVISCIRSAVLEGSPPDLTLTVSLPEVTPQMNGNWRLVLFNDAGSGTFDFFLSVTEHGVPSVVIIAAVASVVALVIIVIVIVVVVVRQKKKKKSGHFIARGSAGENPRIASDGYLTPNPPPDRHPHPAQDGHPHAPAHDNLDLLPDPEYVDVPGQRH